MVVLEVEVSENGCTSTYCVDISVNLVDERVSFASLLAGRPEKMHVPTGNPGWPYCTLCLLLEKKHICWVEKKVGDFWIEAAGIYGVRSQSFTSEGQLRWRQQG